MPEEPLGVRDRSGVVAALFEECGEALEGLEIALAKPLALFEDPLIVATFEEVSRVQVDGLSQRAEIAVGGISIRSRERLLKGSHVEPVWCVRPPPERPRRHVEEPVSLREGTSEMVEHMAEIRPRLRLGRVGPKKVSETLPGLRCFSVEEEVG